MRTLIKTISQCLAVLCMLASFDTQAHECTAKVRATSWDVTSDWAGKPQTSIAFAIEGGMWMTTDWGGLKCTVLWDYEVFWVDEAGAERSFVFPGSESFFGRDGKQGERVSESIEAEVVKNSPFMHSFSKPQRILRVIVKRTKTSTSI